MACHEGRTFVQQTMPSDLASFAQFAMDEQTSKDEARDAVLGQLSRAVLGNYTAFIGGMKHIGEVDMDVARAMIHVSNALRQLRAARNTLTVQSLQVTAKHRRLLRLRAVSAKLQWIAAARSAGSATSAAVSQGRFLDAATVAASAASKLGGSTAGLYSSLQGDVSRAAQALPRLAAAMDGAVHKLAQQWVATDPTPATTRVMPRVHAWLVHVAAECTTSSLLQHGGGSDTGSDGSSTAKALEQESGFWESLPPLLQLPRVFPSLVRAYARLDEAGVADCREHLETLPSKLQEATLDAMKHATKAALIDIVLRCNGARRTALAAVRAAQLAGEALSPDASAVAKQQTAAAARKRAASSATGRSRAGTAAEPTPGEEDADAGEGLQGAAARLARAVRQAQSAYKAEHARLWDGRFADVCRELGEIIAHKCEGGTRPDEGTASDGATSTSTSTSDAVWQAHLSTLRSAVRSAGVCSLDTEDGDDSDPLRAHAGDWVFEGQQPVSGCFLLPQIMARLGAAVASTAHWHLLLARLMQCFGDERCSNWAFLHSSQAPVSEHEDPLRKRVSALRPQLLQWAPALWSAVQERVGGALAAIAAAAGDALPASGLQAALAVALDIQRVGVQYVAAASVEDPAQELSDDTVAMASLVQGAAPLRASLRLACASLLDAQHTSAMQRLRSLLAKELWTPVPLPPTALAGVLARVTHSHPLWWQWTPQWAAAAPYAANVDGRASWSAAAHNSGRPSAGSPGVGRVWAGLHSTPPWLHSHLEAPQHTGIGAEDSHGSAALAAAASRVIGFGFASRVWVGSAAGGAADVSMPAPWRRALPAVGSLLSATDSEARLSHPCIAAAVAAVSDLGDGVLLGAVHERALGRLLRLRMEVGAPAEGETVAVDAETATESDDGVAVLLARGEVLGYGLQWRGGVHWWQVYAAAAPPDSSSCPALSGGNPFGRVCDGPLPDKQAWQATLLAARGVVEAAEKLAPAAAAVTVAPQGEATPGAALAALALGIIPRLTWQRDDLYVWGVPLLPVGTGAPAAGAGAAQHDSDTDEGCTQTDQEEGAPLSVMTQAVLELCRGSTGGAGVVCTSAGVNGLLPAVARYVRLLQCCPGLAVETWEALSGAMDLFFHTSASCALPLPALRAVVQGQGARMAAIAAHVSAAKGTPLTAADIPESAVSSEGQHFPYLDSNAVPPAVLTGVAAAGALHAAGGGAGGSSGRLLCSVATATAAVIQAAKRDPWPLPFLTLRSVLLHAGARLRHTALFEGHAGAASTGGSTAGGRSRDEGSDRVSVSGLARTAQRRLGMDSASSTPSKRRPGASGSVFHSPSVHSGGGGGTAATNAADTASAGSGDTSWLAFHAVGAGIPAPLVPACEAAELGGEMETLEWGSAPLPNSANALPHHDIGGLPARTVAAEAAQQLLLALAAASPWLQGCLPAAGHGTLRAWVGTLSTAVLQLRAACCNAMVARLAPELGGVPRALGSMHWDKVQDVTAGDGAEYVAATGAVLQRAGAALQDARTQGLLPPVSHLGVWLATSGRLFGAVALGVARVPKATLEGRGVMAMHANTLGVLLSRHGPSLPALLAVAPPPGRHSGVAAVAGHGRPMADKAWLDAFIKAYYFGDASEDALAWLKASACVSGAKGREGTLVPLAPWGALLPHLLSSPPADNKGGHAQLVAAAVAVGSPPALAIVAGSRGSTARGSGAGVYRAPYPLEVGKGLLEQAGSAGSGMLGRGGGDKAKAGKAAVQSLVQWHAAAAALDITALLGIEAEAGGAFLGADGEQ